MTCNKPKVNNKIINLTTFWFVKIDLRLLILSFFVSMSLDSSILVQMNKPKMKPKIDKNIKLYLHPRNTAIDAETSGAMNAPIAPPV